jgi:hypothetical protein
MIMRIFPPTATIAAGLLIGSVAVAQDIVWTLEGPEAPANAMPNMKGGRW